jgi:urea transport system ATP-binding protein
MLEIQGVSASYGKSPVLDSIDMSIAPGESVTLLGRNGVGKSTLLRTIVGHQAVARGSITFLGEDVTRSPSYQRARLGIGYVPQGRGIFPHLSVEENLRLGTAAIGKQSGSAAQDIPDYIYELFPVLRRVSHRKGGVLSGGEQQQLAIARAMVSKPKLLILDEPTEGIQPSIVQQIEETLIQVRVQLKIGILLVEQYLDFAWSIGDKFYVMRRGQIVATGNPRESDSSSIHHLLSV